MTSVLMMCAGSLLIAFLPTYATIGAAAPALLLFARLLQGLSVGGEYGTSATYMSEVALKGRRGFFASFQYVTLIGGQLLAVLVLVILQQLLTAAQLKDWGWRIPFVVGACAAIVARYLRRSLNETSTADSRKNKNAGTIAGQYRRYESQNGECGNDWRTACLYADTTALRRAVRQDRPAHVDDLVWRVGNTEHGTNSACVGSYYQSLCRIRAGVVVAGSDQFVHLDRRLDQGRDVPSRSARFGCWFVLRTGECDLRRLGRIRCIGAEIERHGIDFLLVRHNYVRDCIDCCNSHEGPEQRGLSARRALSRYRGSKEAQKGHTLQNYRWLDRPSETAWAPRFRSTLNL